MRVDVAASQCMAKQPLKGCLTLRHNPVLYAILKTLIEMWQNGKIGVYWLHDYSW
jgi:hypothetical protein